MLRLRFASPLCGAVALLAPVGHVVASDRYDHLNPKTRALLQQLDDKYRSGVSYLPGYETRRPDPKPALPKVFAPTQPRAPYTKYPWKRNIVATIFWVGELPTQNNPVPNTASSWDTKWQESFGGYDDPNPAARDWDFTPKAFTPKQNPFYIALPYNDLEGWRRTKPSAQKIIPWYKERYNGYGRTVIKGTWLAIRHGTKVCYAQWEDVGPFNTDDWEYVFGDARPANTKNSGAGIDISPAVRDYLNLQSAEKCDWRFVEVEEVPPGPWRKFGDNNPFVNPELLGSRRENLAKAEERRQLQEKMVRLREKRDAYILQMKLP